MPAIAIHPPDNHYDILFETLTQQHGSEAVCAAYLLVYARRALRAYNTSRGRYADVLVPLLTDAVGTWAYKNGTDRAKVSQAADTLVAHLITYGHELNTDSANETPGCLSPQLGPPQKQ